MIAPVASSSFSDRTRDGHYSTAAGGRRVRYTHDVVAQGLPPADRREGPSPKWHGRVLGVRRAATRYERIYGHDDSRSSLVARLVRQTPPRSTGEPAQHPCCLRHHIYHHRICDAPPARSPLPLPMDETSHNCKNISTTWIRHQDPPERALRSASRCRWRPRLTSLGGYACHRGGLRRRCQLPHQGLLEGRWQAHRH